MKGQNPNVSEAEKVISLVDDFSLPFCQLKLQILFNAESKEEAKGDIVDVMFNAAVSDSGAKRSHWVNLVDLMSRDAVRQVGYADPTIMCCADLNRSENELRRSFSQCRC